MALRRRRARRNYSKGARGRAQWRSRLKRLRSRGRKFVKIGRRRHRIASLLGGKRRRAGKRRSRGSSRRTSRKRRKNPLLEALGNPVRRRRRRRRNAWKGDSAGHARAARKGWRKRGKRRAGKRRTYRRGHRVSPKRRAAGRRAWATRHARRAHAAYAIGDAFGSLARRNPRHRRRFRPNPSRRYRRFRRRSNPGFGGTNWKSMATQAATFGAGYFGARALSGGVNWAIGKAQSMGLPIPAAVQPHLPAISSVLTVLAADQLTRRVGVLRKYRTPIMVGAGILAFQRIMEQYVVPKLPEGIRGYLGLGAVPSYWSTPPYVEYAQGVGEYVEVPPGVGLRGLQEAAGEYVEVPPGVGLAGLVEAAGEYVEVPPGVGLSGVTTGYEGHKIAGAPVGRMPVPRTLSSSEAAYESQTAGDEGIFESQYGIFGG